MLVSARMWARSSVQCSMPGSLQVIPDIVISLCVPRSHLGASMCLHSVCSCLSCQSDPAAASHTPQWSYGPTGHTCTPATTHHTSTRDNDKLLQQALGRAATSTCYALRYAGHQLLKPLKQEDVLLACKQHLTRPPADIAERRPPLQTKLWLRLQ